MKFSESQAFPVFSSYSFMKRSTASSLDGTCSSLLLPIVVPTRPQDLNIQYLCVEGEHRTQICGSAGPISGWVSLPWRSTWVRKNPEHPKMMLTERGTKGTGITVKDLRFTFYDTECYKFKVTRECPSKSCWRPDYQSAKEQLTLAAGSQAWGKAWVYRPLDKNTYFRSPKKYSKNHL